jgi:hypothetical protein
MEVMLKSLTQHAGVALAITAVLLAAQAIWLARTAARLRSWTNRWRSALKGVRGENLEELLERHLHERALMQDHLSNLLLRVEALENELKQAKRHVGITRYDAFDDVTGNQSWSLALYDDGGDGAVLSGIVSRSACRVYCKPLVGGRSERNLSQEELRAIREATNGVNVGVVTP